MKSKHFKKVYFVDSAKHLIDRLKKRALSQSFLFPLKAEELNLNLYGNVVIAGVGAETMERILYSLQGQNHLFAERLILSPHKDEERLDSMNLYDYQLVLKSSVQERQRVRPVFVFDRLIK